MHIKSIFSIIGILFVSALCGAIENPNVGSPFKTRNAPTQSGQQQRYITRGNPYGNSGNDIVTGNVGGGKHFRGVVPYGSSYYSGAYSGSRGSRSVNNFIRRSAADPIVNDRNPGQTRTYYDPSRSVSSMRRPDGTSGLSNPQLTGQGRRTNPYIVPDTATRMVTTPQYQRPLSANNMDLEQILSRREQLRQEAEDQADLTEKESGEKKGFFDEALSPDLFKQEEEQEAEVTLAPEENALTKILKERQKTDDEQILEMESEEAKTQDEAQPADRTSPESDLVPKLDIGTLGDEGSKVLGEHKTFESLSNEKFTGFMDAAEAFIKDEQFYKAANTYALAIVWKPNDARGYLGQSFSLFAAGEYMSSAYYLSRAFELDPKVTTKKYNLAEFLGNRDVFESRVLEMTTWQERSGSGELAFLLAYISYQDDKASRAVDQIQRAKRAMPDEPSVNLLKNIIDPEEVL